ncbi:MAG: hypothetical protein IPK13_09940 [Deltaproteobacteria bacterium]|nr:hypothetical protein [Deltaproteobacteria bacterium]
MIKLMKRYTSLAALVALAMLPIELMGCGAVDNINSEVVCGDYCGKKYACANQAPTSDERSGCVTSCRNSIENNCGNEHQAAANDRIGECVDKACAEFWPCMVLDAAPSCFGFVSQ